MRKFLIIASLVVISFGSVWAQEYDISPEDIHRSPVRRVLNMFSFTVSTGYHAVTYKHSLNGYYLIQTPDNQYITIDTGEALGLQFDSYENWLNDPALALPVALEDTFSIPFPGISNPVLNPALINDNRAYDADSLGLGFKRTSWAVPLNVRLRFNYKGFRIGGGVSLLYHQINSLKPTVEGLGIRNYEPNVSSVFQFQYFGMLGYKFYDFWDYSFAAELEIGKDKYLGSKFNQGAMNQRVYYNFGISIEKNISEYFRIIVKPSYDLRSFDMNLPGGSIRHGNNSFNIDFGISITIPEIPRSPMPSDHIQLKHVIQDPKNGYYYEVRGQPIWKRQNPKVGENHRKLWRYRWRNKRKMNPY
ncbi:hypothetical protein [Reichenbachiella ulvae]|uniref:Outer membrane protein beta-barrel domain-containing protein n=1 Tax=Reichenbachiella ulvae TaxID=2980104 RepID=A0ABT3CR89_9BACT|nr:hypothetical protein [Reichenbachiella ulvae]MCV9386086.1 hypothetical protein [Reichenbachiella ulvae]